MGLETPSGRCGGGEKCFPADCGCGLGTWEPPAGILQVKEIGAFLLPEPLARRFARTNFRGGTSLSGLQAPADSGDTVSSSCHCSPRNGTGF